MKRFTRHEWAVTLVFVFVIAAVIFSGWFEARVRARCRDAGGVPIRLGENAETVCWRDGTPIDVWSKP